VFQLSVATPGAFSWGISPSHQPLSPEAETPYESWLSICISAQQLKKCLRTICTPKTFDLLLFILELYRIISRDCPAACPLVQQTPKIIVANLYRYTEIHITLYLSLQYPLSPPQPLSRALSVLDLFFGSLDHPPPMPLTPSVCDSQGELPTWYWGRLQA
jgi:hypothetical protein